MTKARLFIVAGTVFALMAACGPKSRYRAKNFDLPLAPLGTKSPVTEISPIPAGLDKDLTAPSASVNEGDKALMQTLEHLALAKAKDDDGTFKLNLYVTTKTGKDLATHLVQLGNLKNPALPQKISKLGDADLRESIEDSKLHVNANCTDEKCDALAIELKNDKAEVKANAKVDTIKMKVTNGDEKQSVDEKLKSLVDSEIAVQRARVLTSGAEYFTLSIMNDSLIVFEIQRNKAIQKLNIVYGKKLGIASADYNGTAEKFELTLKNKDNAVLAKLKFDSTVEAPKPAVTPTPTAPVADSCGSKDTTDLLRLSCFRQVDAKGERIAEHFAVKVDVNSDSADARLLKWHADGGKDDEHINLANGESSRFVDAFVATAPLKVSFESEDGKSQALVILSDACCKENHEQVVPAPAKN